MQIANSCLQMYKQAFLSTLSYKQTHILITYIHMFVEY